MITGLFKSKWTKDKAYQTQYLKTFRIKLPTEVTNGIDGGATVHPLLYYLPYRFKNIAPVLLMVKAKSLICGNHH